MNRSVHGGRKDNLSPHPLRRYDEGTRAVTPTGSLLVTLLLLVGPALGGLLVLGGSRSRAVGDWVEEAWASLAEYPEFEPTGRYGNGSPGVGTVVGWSTASRPPPGGTDRYVILQTACCRCGPGQRSSPEHLDEHCS